MNQTRLGNLDLELHKEYKKHFKRITMQFGQCRALLLLLFGVITLGILSAAESAYAQTTDVYAFYGGSPKNTGDNSDCPPPTGGTCIGQGTVDATDQGPLGDNFPGCMNDVSCLPSNVDTSDGGLIEVGHQIEWRSVSGMGPLIEVTCYTNAPQPSGDGSWTINFGAGGVTDWSCLQNQRAANDLGFGGTAITILAPEDEIDLNELIVLDLTNLVNADYDDFMYRLSSNTGGDQALLALSDTAPSGMITLTNAETIIDDDTDVYKSFPNGKKKFLYIREVGGDDLLLQQIKAEVDVIGGKGIQLDATSILLAGAQTNAFWILPMIVLATIIGIITIRRK